VAAERVFDYMVEDLAQPQLQLFEDAVADPSAHRVLVAGLQERNPGKLILHRKAVHEYRYIAAFLGAGFHMSQYDEVTYRQNGDAGQYVVERDVMSMMLRGRVVPERTANHNRMHDEVDQELFNKHFNKRVPSTDYDLSTGHYITTEEDLKQIFAFDYENLRACKDLDMDLLYEREI
jgi:hypothetical protein